MKNDELTNEEKNLLNAAFKNPLCIKRRQWRSCIEMFKDLPHEKKHGSMEARLLKHEIDIIEGEIINLIKFQALPLIEPLL